MKELRKKLKDRSGASILLALLFFLLCSMVGASVLMAAVSNAGKIRSNREEQQKYLLLSSALRLVCDELTSAEYYGQYTYRHYYTETYPQKLGADGSLLVDEHGNPVLDLDNPIKDIYHEYVQTSGDFQCGLKDVLQLTNELDLIFASKFPESKNEDKVHYTYTPFGGSFTPLHELALSVADDGPDGLKDKVVTVKVQIDQDLRIHLTATLGEEVDGDISEKADGYISMEALLTGQGSLALDEDSDPPVSDLASVSAIPMETGPVTWKLEWIAKKEAGG